MGAATLLSALDMLSVALVVAAVGLKSRLGLGLAFVRGRPGAAARAMLAMFVAVPAFVLLVTWLVPLERPVALALLALSVSPMPPVLPITERQVGGKPGYVAGTLLLAPMVAMVAIPLLIWVGGGVFGHRVDHDLAAALQVIVLTLGAPLLIGLLVKRHAPTLAARLVRPVSRLGSGLLVVVIVALLVFAWPAMISALGNGTLIVVLATASFGLLVGHLAGGPKPGNRRALALICSQRHPGVAMAIAIAAFPDEAAATLGAVVVYVLASSAIAFTYARSPRKRGPQT